MENLRLKQLMMMGLILLALSGCQEEEFYEKDIDGAIEKFERENRTIEEDDEAEQTNAEEDGYADDNGDGSNNGGSDNGDGSNNGGDDNGDGSDNGGDDNGDGSDNGGDDNGDGSDNGDDDNTPTIIQKSDSFTQSGKRAKTDILWVVDNSGSMADEQQALADNFDTFIKDFAEKDIDFQMGITTTDRMLKGGPQHLQYERDVVQKLNSEAMKKNKKKFIKDFKNEIKVGIKGYGFEKGIESSYVYLAQNTYTFNRDDAYLAIVYVSDERDQSNKDPEYYLNKMANMKGNAGLIRAYSIVDMDNTVSSQYVLKGYERYKKMSDSTNGSVANLYGDFHAVIQNIASSIVNLTEEFPLSSRPYNYTEIIVKVNGFESVEWEYIEASNTIKFLPGAAPADGSTIRVIYNVEE